VTSRDALVAAVGGLVAIVSLVFAVGVDTFVVGLATAAGAVVVLGLVAKLLAKDSEE
jgi:hypothetical protein